MAWSRGLLVVDIKDKIEEGFLYECQVTEEKSTGECNIDNPEEPVHPRVESKVEPFTCHNEWSEVEPEACQGGGLVPGMTVATSTASLTTPSTTSTLWT